GPAKPPANPNMQSLFMWSKGDVEEGLAQSDRVFEHTFFAERTHQGYIEPRACALHIEPDGTVRIWSSCKVPYRLRDLIAELFDLPEDTVVVEPSTIGGDFGAKGEVGPEPVAYALARATGRPIKVIRSYTEELEAGNPRHPAVMRLRTGVMNDGTLVARDVQITMNGGAYAALKYNPDLILPSVNRCFGPYRIPSAQVECRWAYTNNVPGGIARAPGQPQVVFAGESQIDLIAQELGIDPLEFRLRNAVQDGEELPTGNKPKGFMAQPTLQLARQASGWDEPLPPWRGRGAAISERNVGAGQSGLTVTLHDDGQVTALSAVPDIGCGTFTVLQQVLSERLHLPLDMVSVVAGSTAEALKDTGTGGSKTTYSVIVAASQAAGEINPRLQDIAAQRLECAIDDLEAVETAYRVKGAPQSAIPTVELVMEAARQEGGDCETESPGPGHGERAPQMCCVACVAEVEVDPETGHVKPVKITMATDAGQAINPRLLQGQVEGAMLQGLGIALMEELPSPDGRVAALHLGDYKLPVIGDLPELISVFVEDAPGPEPYGAKAVGELGVVPVAAAVANAVAAAAKVRVTSLPVTAEKVLQGLGDRV
ncbi:MAG TPA: molybdopterin cofactor-binding domain-containing protein, partial [Chloroflexota bacterium]|nr:molybdopterin cofactor-binding domain-containing protein [Chloroflexota bacterium]